MDVIEHSDDPYKAEIDWKEEGVKIVVTAEALGFSEADRAEANRRAKTIIDHFKLIIPRT